MPQPPAIQPQLTASFVTALPLQLHLAQPLRFEGVLITQFLDLGAKVAAPTDLVDRSQVTVPVSPTATFDLSTLFEDPATPTTRRYLPTYSIRRETVRFIQTETGFQLTMVLQPSPPPAGVTSAIDAPLTAVLRYTLSGAGLQREVRFDEVLAEDGGIRIRATSADPQLRTDTFFALTEPSGGARLEVSRAVTAAVPVGTRPDLRRRVLEARKLQQLRLKRVPLMATGTRMAMPIERVDVAKKAPVRRPGPIVTRPLPGQLPDRVRLPIERVDVEPVEVEPVEVEPEPEPPATVTKYRVVTTTLTQPAHPGALLFSPTTDPDVFVGVSGGGGPAVTLQQCTVGGHTYFQEAPGSRRFFFLPDSFRLLRQLVSPHTPLMQLSFDADDDAADASDTEATLELGVMPWTDPARIEAAAVALTKKLASGQEAQLEPLNMAVERLAVSVDVGGPATDARPVLDAPHRSLTRPFQCRLSARLEQFRRIYERLHGSGGAIEAGMVEVRVGQSETAYTVPFHVRLDTALCPVSLIDVSNVARPDAATITATLTNGIESPLRLRQPKIVVRRGEQDAPATITQPAFAAPVELAPGAAIDVVISVDAAESENAPVLLVQEAGIDVVLDQGAVYDAILSPTLDPDFVRSVTAEVSARVFADAPDLQRLVVDFERGTTVTIERPTAPSPGPFLLAPAPAELAMPFRSLLLSDTGELPSEVRYRVQGYYSDRKGEQTDWQTEDAVFGADGVGRVTIFAYPPKPA
jgi:hypothetical protein